MHFRGPEQRVTEIQREGDGASGVGGIELQGLLPSLQPFRVYEAMDADIGPRPGQSIVSSVRAKRERGRT